MSITSGFAGVSNCYVFKSRLQEYAQKECFPTPVYETLKEGPSHEPCFRSTVTVNNVTYESLPGFFNRKASEQSAAEVALLDLAKSGNTNESITNPVHETGLCKNLLQEYAQKMNYAIPAYTCRQNETQGKRASFTCTVDIGGIQYIGASASSKKEAEIKAARTALIAIQSSSNGTETQSNGGDRQLTVVPTKKKGQEPEVKKEKTKKPLKPRKVAFKKKMAERKKLLKDKLDNITGNTESSQNGSGAPTDALITPVPMGLTVDTGDAPVAPGDAHMAHDLMVAVDTHMTPEMTAGRAHVAPEMTVGEETFGLENSLLTSKQNQEMVVEAENVQRVVKLEQAGVSQEMVVEAENVQRVVKPEQADVSQEMVVEAENVQRVVKLEQADVSQDSSLTG